MAIQKILKHTAKTIVQDIDKEESIEFLLEEGTHLTLLLLSFQSLDSHVTVRLNGRGARASIVGILLGQDASVGKLHTLQHHEAPETTSNLLVKGVLRDSAQFLYDGAIRVEKRAQHTDAYQRNENLLLSPQAYAESKPSLEILANDVRCTHGATISSLPHDQLWYAATRGIGPNEARMLFVGGFLKSALGCIDDEKVRQRVWRRIEDQL